MSLARASSYPVLLFKGSFFVGFVSRRIVVEGEIMAGYFFRLMVNPQEAAKIFVDYDYALYCVLGEYTLGAMGEDLG